MFLSKSGQYESCGMFTFGHLILVVITIICIYVTLKKTIHKNKNEVKGIIKKCTIFIWFLEIIIIDFKLTQNNVRDVNTYLPLYYCSMLLYAGLFSSFAKGKLQRIGDVFLATGGMAGGLIYLILPTTSLPAYPMFHLVSIHSFIFHGIMIYLSILVNITNYIELEKNDIIYYSSFVGILCILAFIVNQIFESNLMFISRDFPGTPITVIYKYTGILFTPFMCIVQMILPFICMYGIIKNKKIEKYKQLLLKKYSEPIKNKNIEKKEDISV